MRSLRLLLIAALAPLAAVSLVETPARADATAPLTGYRSLLLDDAAQRVFVSQGSDGVAVFDLAATPLGTVPGLTDTGALTSSPDGATVYVARPAHAEIVAVDAATLTTTSIPTGDGTCPDGLALLGGLVWFTDSCSAGSSLGSVDPVTGDATAYPVTGLGGRSIRTSPALPDRLLAYGGGANLRAFDVTWGDTLTVAAGPVSATKPLSLAIPPDGGRLLASNRESSYTKPVWLNASTLAWNSTLRYGLGGRAVAVRPSGEMAVYNDEYLYTYDSGQKIPYESHALGRATDPLVDALAFGPSGVYFVADTKSGPELRWHVPTHDSFATVTTDRRTYDWGQRATVSVTLEHFGTNRTVRVYAQPKGRPRTLVGEALVDDNGVAQVTHRMTRQTTFTAEYSGDEVTKPSTAKRTIDVRLDLRGKTVRYYRKKNGVAFYRVGGKAWFEFTVRTAYGKNRLSVYIDARIGGRWRTIAGADYLRIPDNGKVRVYMKGRRAYLGKALSAQGWFYDHYGDGSSKHTKRLPFRFVR